MTVVKSGIFYKNIITYNKLNTKCFVIIFLSKCDDAAIMVEKGGRGGASIFYYILKFAHISINEGLNRKTAIIVEDIVAKVNLQRSTYTYVFTSSFVR